MTDERHDMTEATTRQNAVDEALGDTLARAWLCVGRTIRTADDARAVLCAVALLLREHGAGAETLDLLRAAEAGLDGSGDLCATAQLVATWHGADESTHALEVALFMLNCLAGAAFEPAPVGPQN